MPRITNYEEHRIVIFDGVCNLCHAGVMFIIKHDAQSKIKYVTAQSDLGQYIQKQLGIDILAQETSIFYDAGSVYIKGKGGLYVCKYLDGVSLKLLSLFRFLPHFILDPIYNYIAKNRYAWYGKKEQCMVPTPDVVERFL